MNERIIDLYEQACNIERENEIATKPYKDRVVITFAELIVRECGIVADHWVNDEDNGTNLVSERLKQHFGVKPDVNENLRNRSTYFGNDI